MQMMSEQPNLKTKRLLLRPFSLHDASDVQSLAGDANVAETTASVPHPYLDGIAEEWINTHQHNWDNGSQCVYAITDIGSSTLFGAISIIDIKNHIGEIGYWIGSQYWGDGYCSEACNEIIRFGFECLSLTKLHAHHLSRNPASGKVLLNAGMVHKRSEVITFPRNGTLEQIEYYEIVKTK